MREDLRLVQALCDEIAERLSTIYVEEMGHGPGGISLTIERCARPGIPLLPAEPVVDLAMIRLYGLATRPRFGRTGPSPEAPPEGPWAIAWRETLLGLAGPAATAALRDEGGCDDGLILYLVAPEGAWAIHADQAHD